MSPKGHTLDDGHAIPWKTWVEMCGRAAKWWSTMVLPKPIAERGRLCRVLEMALRSPRSRGLA